MLLMVGTFVLVLLPEEPASALVNFQDVLPEDRDADAASDGRRTTLALAVAPRFSPAMTQHHVADLLALMRRRLNMSVVLVQKETAAEILDMLQYREVNAAMVPAGVFATGRRAFGLALLAVPVIQGEPHTWAWLIVNRAASAASLLDLRQGRFALIDPLSYSGFSVPEQALALQGYGLDSFFSEVFYTQNHEDAIKAVAEGLADGAYVDADVWRVMNDGDPFFTQRTKKVGEAVPCGAPPVAVHPDMPRALVRRLERFFLSMHETQEGQAALKALQIDRFIAGRAQWYESARFSME